MATLIDDFQGNILGIETGKGSSRLPPSRKEKLQQELKLLEWHKMANNAAIKSALLQTKSLKVQSSTPSKSSGNGPPNDGEDAKWMKKIIQQEHVKPLEVSKDYVLDYESREKQNNERLSTQVDRHIQTLKSLRMKLEARHDLKSRTDEYRQWQKEFLPKKHAVLVGKTLEEITALQGPMSGEEANDGEIDEEALQRHMHKKSKGGNGASSQELSTVLDSLGRLAELEKRITSLEKENRYDELTAKEQPTANQRTTIEFRKKRHTGQEGNGAAAPVGNSTGMMYEVRGGGVGSSKQQSKADKQWKIQVPAAAAGNAGAAVKAQKQQREQAQRMRAILGDQEPAEDEGEYVTEDEGAGNGRGNVFITAQTSTDNLRGSSNNNNNNNAKMEALRRERLRQQQMQPAGVKALRQRVQQRKGRTKEQTLGNKKHEEAMREMARRKQEQRAGALDSNVSKYRKGPVTIGKVRVPAKGMGAGVKTNNKHLADFEKMKQQNNKRKENIQLGNKNQRYASQTTPAYAVSAHKRVVNNSNNTRRTDNPRRTAPPPVSTFQQQPVAVTGMGGLRVIRANHMNNNNANSNKRR